MDLRVVSSIDQIGREKWNALRPDSNPFVSFEFLSALEAQGIVGDQTGWQPSHLTFYENGELVAVAPAYIKYHSWGEFVFDFAWADAYQRYGVRYYPKLVLAVPYSPILGPRLLFGQSRSAPDIAAIQNLITAWCKSQNLSSLHTLFPQSDQARDFDTGHWIIREGFQYHWHNRGYRDVQDFLDSLSSRKRKNIRKEREKLAALGVEVRNFEGEDIASSHWSDFYQFYCKTFIEHHNVPILSEAFFQQIGATLKSQVVLVIASQHGKTVGSALCLKDGHSLYGRYWGGRQELPGLHFETCYYQGIELCIEQKLKTFEPGVQGEHKLARGFLPSLTQSFHWIADERFRDAIENFCAEEREANKRAIDYLMQHSPYRQAIGDDSDTLSSS